MPGREATWLVSQDHVPSGGYRPGEPIPQSWEDLLAPDTHEQTWQELPEHIVLWLNDVAKASTT